MMKNFLKLLAIFYFLFFLKELLLVELYQKLTLAAILVLVFFSILMF